MKTEHTIRRELARVKKSLKRTDLTPVEDTELYGAQQALEWMLSDDAMSPSQAALLGRKTKRGGKR